MPVLVKALGYYSYKGGPAAKGLSRLKAHLKYLEHGKVHMNEPQGFSAERDYLTRDDFLQVIKSQPERGVIAHKLVFSLSQDEQQRLGIDMRGMVRSVMDDWGNRIGRPLNWIGFEHQDDGHPHVHVVVAGYAGERQVGVYERDLISLRGSAERELGRQATLEKTLPVRQIGHDLADEADRLFRQMERILQRARGAERSRDR